MFADGSQLITEPSAEFVSALALRNALEQPSTFWRSTIHRRAGELDESFKLAFDWEWWNRLKVAGARFEAVSRILSTYYFSNDNLTSRAGLRVVEEMYRVTKAYGPRGGMLADVYRFLFEVFDMRGFYDWPFAQLSPGRRAVFGGTLACLYALFGREHVNAYNWNWASKQVRGVVWYK